MEKKYSRIVDKSFLCDIHYDGFDRDGIVDETRTCSKKLIVLCKNSNFFSL